MTHGDTTAYVHAPHPVTMEDTQQRGKVMIPSLSPLPPCAFPPYGSPSWSASVLKEQPPSPSKESCGCGQRCTALPGGDHSACLHGMVGEGQVVQMDHYNHHDPAGGMVREVSNVSTTVSMDEGKRLKEIERLERRQLFAKTKL